MQIINVEYTNHNFNYENNNFGINGDFLQNLREVLLAVNFTTPQQNKQGTLSNKIIERICNSNINLEIDDANLRCNLNLRYKYDGVINIVTNRIALEIQFRPDFLKDITRFLIGFNAYRICAIVYIVSIDRNNINANYTTMPEYQIINSQLSLFTWFTIPILVVGVDCNN